nr:MAG TPA: AIR synthase related protein [Caudoviricetes sp.]
MLNITKPIWNELANGIQKRCNTVEILIGGGDTSKEGCWTI